MFEGMRIQSLFPPSGMTMPQMQDPLEELSRLRMLTSDPNEDNIRHAELMRQFPPINRYSQPNTTNNLVSQGLTPANTQVNTVAAPSNISPLDLAKLKQGQEKIDLSQSKESIDSGIRQQRADVYDYKAKHPDHKFDFSGPTVKVMNPNDGSVYDTGLDTGKLSMEDKMKLSSNLGTARDINKITTQGNVNITRDMGKHEDTLREIAAKGAETRKTQAAKPVTTSNTQVNQGYLNKANELLNSDPKYKDYIDIKRDLNGKPVGFTVKPPTSGMGSDDPTYHEVNSKIYGDQGSDVVIPPADKSQSFSSSTTKAYQDKNGNKYNIPMDKVTQFLQDNPDAQEVK